MVPLGVEVKNISSEEKSIGVKEADAMFGLDVRDSAGNAVPETRYGRMGAGDWEPGTGETFPCLVRVSAGSAHRVVSMPRSKRVVAVGAPHHVTQRGNGRQDVFLIDGLRRVYLELLAEHAARYGLRVLAHCLITNHVHLVAVPESERSLANEPARPREAASRLPRPVRVA
jgi:hypothetical protein